MNTIPEGTLTLTYCAEVAKNTKVFRFRVDSEISFLPGQFISLKFQEKSWRAYSIASSPNDTEIELIVRIIEGGIGSTALTNASLGDIFTFRGPYGMFTLSESSSTKILCGTGTGIAPFRSMVRTQESLENTQLWYGGRNPEDIGYLNEIKTWKTPTKLAFSQLNETEIQKQKELWKPYPHVEIYAGRITQFPANTKEIKDTEFYICGNGDMVKSLETILKEEYFVEKTQIHKERFN